MDQREKGRQGALQAEEVALNNQIREQQQHEQMLQQMYNQYGMNESARQASQENAKLPMLQQEMQRQQEDSDFNRAMQKYNMSNDARGLRRQDILAEYNLAQRRKADLENQRQNLIQRQTEQLQIGQGLRDGILAKNLHSKTTQNAMTNWVSSNDMQLDRHKVNVNTINQDYQNHLGHYNAQGPSLGESLIPIATTAIGMGVGAFGGGIGAGIGANIGRKVGESFTSGKNKQGA
jgi:hypothetical protein